MNSENRYGGHLKMLTEFIGYPCKKLRLAGHVYFCTIDEDLRLDCGGSN